MAKETSQQPEADQKATGNETKSAGEASEPEPALKVKVIRNPQANAPFITQMSVSRGDQYEVLLFDEKAESWELSIDDARQCVELQRTEIPQGEGKPEKVDYISGFVVAPDSPVKLK